MPLFTVAFGIRQMGLNCPSCFWGELADPAASCGSPPHRWDFSTEIATGGDPIQPLESSPVQRAVVWCNHHSSKRLRAARSGCM